MGLSMGCSLANLGNGYILIPASMLIGYFIVNTEPAVYVLNKQVEQVTAGATGATVFHTRSINNKQAEQLIGTSMKQETDTIAFLTSHAYKARIMEAIRETAGLKTDGNAVIFSLPVDSIVGIGRFEEEE